MKTEWRRYLKILLAAIGLALLFALYARGLSENPPGFYLDEAGLAYNAYLLAHTGAGESGAHFPLFFEYYTGGFVQTGNPTQVYLLAALFRFIPPSILLVRVFSAFCVFCACLLIGLLAKRISGRSSIGIIVGATALLTPWFFEGRGLLIEPQFVPMALAPFLLVLYHVYTKESWGKLDMVMLAASLALITYSTNGGRLMAPFLALGLLLFATTRRRLISVVLTGALYGLTLLPMVIVSLQHPERLSKRMQEVSYIKPGTPWAETISRLGQRYLEDQSLTPLLLTGDYHPRHHVQGAGGALFFGTFILALLGVVLVLAWRRRDPWWRYVLFGFALSVVPGAISVEPFHAMRLMAYPVFVMLLTVPALEWLLGAEKERTSGLQRALLGIPADEIGSGVANRATTVSRLARLVFLVLVLGLTAVEAYRFQVFFRREGPKRAYEFDVPYKTAYDLATHQPLRPIYLEDGKWGPAYINAFWYAAVEGRPISEFVHLAPEAKPPSGAIVISATDTCTHCEVIAHPGVYLVYKAL